MTAMFMRGRSFTEIAKAFDRSPPVIRTAIHNLLKTRNPVAYARGLHPGSSNNYESANFKYLRKHAAEFGFSTDTEPLELYEWI